MLLSLHNCSLNHAPDISWTSHSLVVLRLKKNMITSIPQDYFRDCKKLTNLDLGMNLLMGTQYIHHVRDSLVFLNVRHNGVKFCGPLCDESYPRLAHVDFADNNLQEFRMKSVERWPKLKFLNLNQNHLTTLSDLTLIENSGEEIPLSIGQNPFVCDNRLAWIVTKKMEECVQGIFHKYCFMKYGVFKLNLVDSVPKCHKPEYLQNETVWDLGETRNIG